MDRWCGGRGSNAELANNDEGGQRIGVCYGGICTVGCGGETGKGGRELGYMRRRRALEPSAASMLAPSTAEDGVTCARPDLAHTPAFHHGSQLALSSSPWHACGTLAGIIARTPAQVMWPRHGTLGRRPPTF
jgi:hypothetical protein